MSGGRPNLGKRYRTKKPGAETRQASEIVARLAAQNSTADQNQQKTQNKISKPKAPSGALDAIGMAEWNRIVDLLASIGMLTDLDTSALMLYCDAYSDFMRAVKELKKGKRDIIRKGKNNGGQYRNPWYDVKKAAAKEMFQYLALFGLSPHDRAKMKRPDKNPDRRANEFDDI